ncbi:MAG TPA: hypothetical protein VNA23_02060 [Anaerolineales bacterium]|nr:hypothetical protein [Anaerolineales bacterium]
MPMATPAPTATAPLPLPTAAEKYYSLDTPTTVEEIDAILAAVNSNDKQKLTNLFSYTTIACKTVNALGGPPPCREGEAEGTLVEVLPILGSEGTYLWKDDVSNWPGLDVVGLYAVYKVSDTVFSDENFPKGNYGMILAGEANDLNVVLHIIDARIVRMDYPTSIDEILERDAERVILAPKE